MTKGSNPFRLSAINLLAATLVGVLTAVGGAFQAFAQDTEPTTFWKGIQEKGIYERLWEVPRLYEDQENPVIQTFSIISRYNGQYWNVNTEQGSADGWENRRIYLGAEAVLFHHFSVQAQVKFSEDFDPVYDGLYEAFVNWSPSESLTLAAGQIDFLFAGLERSMSSKKIATFEGGLLANQLFPNEVVGAGGLRLEETYRILDRCSEELWPGWTNYAKIPVKVNFPNGVTL